MELDSDCTSKFYSKRITRKLRYSKNMNKNNFFFFFKSQFVLTTSSTYQCNPTYKKRGCRNLVVRSNRVHRRFSSVYRSVNATLLSKKIINLRSNRRSIRAAAYTGNSLGIPMRMSLERKAVGRERRRPVHFSDAPVHSIMKRIIKSRKKRSVLREG